MIGPYKLLQQIGEGGMGTVYMAEQTEPVKRKVALKVIKAGMDSRQVVARFEAERQALAMMDHVNIARVFDGGCVGVPALAGSGVAPEDRLKPGLQQDGRPYFVMELVHGVPITKYCDDNHLTPRQRLELFVPVCQAIQHAHQKGIIHRDIKPSNVMVTLYDGKPVPKVIDFGVAKATEQKLTERTLFTQYGTMIGTLEYMSPEQAEMSALGVDTRSDIYSLGVLLYELLTGSTPLSRKRMKEAAYAEILRMIKEEEPPKPSTRLSDSGEALASISALRKTEPAKLSKLVRGELDWIVMKTLEKDRNRRYETANAFAADVQRYLNDETVQACPPTTGYKLRKFLRRHQGPVLAATMVLLALVAGVAGSTWQAVRAARAERLAKSRLAEVEKANASTEAALKASYAARRQEEAVSNYLVDLLRSTDPTLDGRQIKIADLLDRAATKLEKEFPANPAIKGRILSVLGETYLGLGLAPKALEMLEKARDMHQAPLGLRDPVTLSSMNSLGRAYCLAGRLVEGLPLLEETLEARKAVLGLDHLDTLTSVNNLAAAYQDDGQRNRAVTLFEQTLATLQDKLGPDHPFTLTIKNNLAGAYQDTGKVDQAVQLYKQVLKEREARLPPGHLDRLISMGNLALAFQAVGQLGEALPLLERTLTALKDNLGPDDPRTLIGMNNLAIAYRDDGRPKDALPLVKEAVDRARKTIGPAHPTMRAIARNLIDLYARLGTPEKADALRRELAEARP